MKPRVHKFDRHPGMSIGILRCKKYIPYANLSEKWSKVTCRRCLAMRKRKRK